MSDTVSILISEEDLQQRIVTLAAEINKDYKGKKITLVCALKGAMIFMADLARRVEVPVIFDFIGASSYDGGTYSTGTVRLTKDLDFDPANKHILLVEDILDTGNTLAFIQKYILDKNPASFKSCCLLDKPERRVVHGVKADYTGFTIPDQFVVGYGLDYDQLYRNLPYIGVLHLGSE